VEIKRTIPKGSAESKDFKTKKIFVGGIPTSITEYEFKNFFSKYGKVVEHEIIRDHDTKRSRGFGFVVFDNEQVVDTILANGNMIDMEGSQMREQKRAALLKEKRASSGLTSPPRVIVSILNEYFSNDEILWKALVSPIEKYAVVPDDNASVLSTVFIVFITGV
ncbi:DAZ-associated protein 1-like, partial [Camellia sinensis]|uniref:DAZ-associated protein 1-like n=1 Tax=Camellia sinensis TaxID=4442 RepID=UPI0010366707